MMYFLIPLFLIQIAFGDVFSPQVELDNQGDAVAVWTETDETGSYVKGALLNRKKSKGWGSPITFSNTLIKANPKIASDRIGNTIVVWKMLDPQTEVNSLFAVIIAANGKFDKPILISEPNENVLSDFQVDVNNQKKIVIVWSSKLLSISPKTVVRSVVGTFSAGLNSPETISN